MKTRVWIGLATLYASVWAWLLVDLWTGSLGELHQDDRRMIILTLLLAAAVLFLFWISVQLTRLKKKTVRPCWWGFPLAIGIVLTVALVIPDPPFSCSRDELTEVARSILADKDSSEVVLDYRPDTRRIGSFDFKRISKRGGSEVYFDSSTPDTAWATIGVVYSPFHEPESIYANNQFVKIEPYGDGWFSYEASL